VLSLLLRRPGRDPASRADHAFAPIAIAEVELSKPLRPVAATGADVRYGSARLVVRLHTRMIGVVDVDLSAGDLAPRACADAVWTALGTAINDHLREDALPAVDGLDELGLAPAQAPPCLERRAAVLRDPPSVSIVICTRNRADLLPRTLASLRALDYPDYEVLVIDGSPGEETADLVRERFPEVHYHTVGDHGRSFALNRGVEVARGTIVACTDDDVRVDRHWLTELVSGFADPRVACVTGLALPLELRTQAQAWFEESGGFTDGFERREIGLDLPDAPGSLLPFATGKIGAGVSMAWRRAVLAEIDGFDVALDTLTPVWPPRAGHGSSAEDLAAFFDALVLGHRIAFEPNAIVFHEHRRDYAALERQLYWHGLGLSAYLFRCLVQRPQQIPGFLKRVPRGLAYGFGTSSVRNDKKSSDFPATLTRAEWRGILNGPPAYLKGLPAARRIRATRAADIHR
jgi:glycosyltransferase involved in cell wall biosynthesis